VHGVAHEANERRLRCWWWEQWAANDEWRKRKIGGLYLALALALGSSLACDNNAHCVASVVSSFGAGSKDLLLLIWTA
jgi:hypothetical protein